MHLQRKAGIFFAALIVAIGGVIYEMIIASAASFLLGDSILHFSLTIGLFLFGMGIGSFFAPRFNKNPESSFAWVEIILGTLGGFSVFLLFSAFAYSNLIYVVFVSLLIFIGALIGLEIPLLLSILKSTSREEHLTITSRILSFDYFGALIASIAFPLVMLPQLGLLRSSFLVGMINLLVALLMIASFSNHIKDSLYKYISVFIGFFILLSGFAFSNQMSNFLNRGIFQDEIILSKQTPYQKVVFTKFNDDLRMYLNGNIQFSSVDEYRYHEPLVHIPISLGIAPKNILVLGGGDGLVARELIKYEEIETIKIVDLDHEVIEISKSFNPLLELNEESLLNPKIEIVNEDAFTYLENSELLYDYIIVDLPDPNNESLAKLYSSEFYQLVKRHLSVGGIMVTQAVSPYFTPNTFWTINSTIESADLYTLQYHNNVPSFGEWGFIVASNLSIDKEDVTIPAIETNILNDINIIKNMFDFDTDMLPTEDISVSTLFDPKVMFVYDSEEKNWQ